MHTLLLPSKPSDLIERIVMLRTDDPTNPNLTLLIDREYDLLKGQTPGGITSPEFQTFVKQFTDCKKQLQASYIENQEIRRALYSKAMETIATADDFKKLAQQLKSAEQRYLAIKTDIDALMSGVGQNKPLDRRPSALEDDEEEAEVQDTHTSR